MKKRKCGLCERLYPVGDLFLHRDFGEIEICKGCIVALKEIEEYGIKEMDDYINLEEYVDYREDSGMLCPAAWLSRLRHLEDERIAEGAGK